MQDDGLVWILFAVLIFSCYDFLLSYFKILVFSTCLISNFSMLCLFFFSFYIFCLSSLPLFSSLLCFFPFLVYCFFYFSTFSLYLCESNPFFFNEICLATMDVPFIRLYESDIKQKLE